MKAFRQRSNNVGARSPRPMGAIHHSMGGVTPPLRSHPRNNRRAGFTLIEVMVASVIFTMLALALGSICSSAFQLWRRISFQHVSERVAIAMAEMVERREEARRFAPLEVKSDAFAFIGLIRSKSGGRQIGELEYWVDPDGKILRRERTYAEYAKEAEGKITELADSAESLAAQELYFNGSNGQFETEPVLGKASKDILPAPDAVKLILTYKTSDGKSHVLERLFRV